MPRLAICLLVALAAGGQETVTLAARAPSLVAEASLDDFLAAPFGVLTSELSPAVVVRCAAPALRLFTGLDEWGLGAPTRLFVPTDAGVRRLTPGDPLPAMSEAWLLASFAGAAGWGPRDAPVLIVLQHRPAGAALADDGLTLNFAGEAGLTAMMPLDGQFGPPLGEVDDDTVARCRRWAGWLRRIPVHLDERFRLEGDEVVIRWHADWLEIDDDWGTPAERLLPLPPVLALAWWAGEHGAERPFPLSLDVRLTDPGLFTPFGPYLGAEGTDAIEARLAVMPYLREQPAAPDIPAGELSELRDWLVADLERKFQTDDWQQIWDHGGPENYCWQVMGDRWYAKALPFLPAELRERASKVLVDYLDQWVLREERYTPFRGLLLLRGPGIGTWGGYDDAGKFSSNLLETIAAIAEATGCWDLIRDRWELILRLDVTPRECDWRSFGRMSIAELGDEAAPPRALARMAWRVGDLETYAFSSYIFARELVHHYVKQVGAGYFQAHPPLGDLEPYPDEVYLTNLWGDVAGWRIDGPAWPREHGERQFTNRWVRFSDAAVGRYYQDVHPAGIRAELELLEGRADDALYKFKPFEDTAHIQPGLPRLRALLLGEPGEAILRRFPRERWRVGRHSDRAAMAVPILQNAAPAVWRADIPPVTSNDVLGLARLRDHGDAALCWALAGPGDGAGPFVRFFGYRPPRGEQWSFGRMVPGAPVGRAQSSWLNWNARVVLFEPE